MKEIVLKCPELFLDMYNVWLLQGRFPEIWKAQKLVPLSKGNGDPDTPSAYRPLCMLDSAGNLLERLMKTRLEKAIEEKRGAIKQAGWLQAW